MDQRRVMVFVVLALTFLTVGAGPGGFVFTASAQSVEIIITPIPSSPPYYLYQPITWNIKAVYSDGTPAYGRGTIIVVKDHYIVENISWNGDPINVTLDSAGYVNLVNVSLAVPTWIFPPFFVRYTTYTNYSLIEAVYPYNFSCNCTCNCTNNTSGTNNTGGGGAYNSSYTGSYVGVQAMSLEIETLYQAGLHDGILAIVLVGLALLPLILKHYNKLFTGPVAVIIVEALLLGATIVLMGSRSMIMTNAYIVQTDNGTTIQPVYTSNPFLRVYIAPLLIETLVMIYYVVELLPRLIEKYL